MGNPKHKVTKSKQGQRRSHHKAYVNASGKCSNCGEMIISHSVCPACGYYDKNQILKKTEI